MFLSLYRRSNKPISKVSSGFLHIITRDAKVGTGTTHTIMHRLRVTL